MEKINLQLIDPNPNQPRKIFTGLEVLAESIKQKGLLEPITVRQVGDRYQVIMGERRLKAAQMAGMTAINAQIKVSSDLETYELALIENLQRENLTPMEEAKAYKELQNQGVKQVAIAASIGKEQSYVAQKIRLLKLPDDIQEAIETGTITEGHARQIARIETHDNQLKAYQIILRKQLSVRQTVMLAAEICAQEEKIKRIAALELEKKLDKIPDKDLLAAIGIERPTTDWWGADDFKLCGKRDYGIFARFIYSCGKLYCRNVYSLGFEPDKQVLLEKAVQDMRRKMSNNVANADLVFIELGIDGINKDYKELQHTQQNTIVIARCGPKQMGIYKWDFWDGVSFLQKNGFTTGILFKCALPEISEKDALAIWEKSSKDNFLDSYDAWLVGSMSRDILEAVKLNRTVLPEELLEVES